MKYYLLILSSILMVSCNQKPAAISSGIVKQYSYLQSDGVRYNYDLLTHTKGKSPKMSNYKTYADVYNNWVIITEGNMSGTRVIVPREKMISLQLASEQEYQELAETYQK